MDKMKNLVTLIEQERKHLDQVVELGLNHEAVYEQSQKLDRLIDEYYGLSQK